MSALPYNYKTRQYVQPSPPVLSNLDAKATKIWEETPTPLYDELVSNLEIQPSDSPHRQYSCSKNNQDLFWSYVEKIGGRAFFKVPTNPSTSGVGQREEKPLCYMNNNWNEYLSAFQDSERAFKLRNIYLKNISQPSRIMKLKNMLISQKLKDFNIKNLNDFKKFVKTENDININIQNMQKRINNNETRRLSKIPTGNLLKLNKSKEPNLLSFEPTKQGLNNRGKELAGLFGGRKTRRSRKLQKRKTRRSRK
jgi:hypothetical protein